MAKSDPIRDLFARMISLQKTIIAKLEEIDAAVQSGSADPMTIIEAVAISRGFGRIEEHKSAAIDEELVRGPLEANRARLEATMRRNIELHEVVVSKLDELRER